MMKAKMNKTATNIKWFAVFGVIAVVFSACSTTSNIATSEYDDIYYSSSDYTDVSTSVASSRNNDRYDNDRYNDRRDDYEASRYGNIYDEDDFYYSRRLRRFSQPNGNAWRYYDPYFSNDLYYVINTPVWNNWYNQGWYSWTRPRFGASVGFGFGDPFMSPFGFNQFNRFGTFNSFNYYNPWVRSYYGFDPYFGYRGFGVGNPWAFNNGFYDGYAYAWNGCPPGAYVSSSSWRTYNVARRANTTSSASQTNYVGRTQNLQREARPTTTSTSTQSRRPNTYLAPKTTTEKNARVNDDYRRMLNTRAADYNSRRSSGVSTRQRTNSRVGTGTDTYRRPTSSDANSRRRIERRPTSRPSTSTRPSTDVRRRPTSSPSRPSYNSRPSTSSPRVSTPSRPSSSGSRPSSSGSRRPQ